MNITELTQKLQSSLISNKVQDEIIAYVESLQANIASIERERDHAQEYVDLYKEAADTMAAQHKVERDKLLEDKDRLDWLENNLFNRENIDWMTGKIDNKYNMWVMFSPIGTQGSARSIIDAARINKE